MPCISIPTALLLTLVIVAANVVYYRRFLPAWRAPYMVIEPPARMLMVRDH